MKNLIEHLELELTFANAAKSNQIYFDKNLVLNSIKVMKEQELKIRELTSELNRYKK